MKDKSSTELLEQLSSLIHKNRSSLSESDLETLKQCKACIENFKPASSGADTFLTVKNVTEIAILLLKYYTAE
tara:strand:- start:178 stop:396 length:219 start_codon:yes stop_codon:yes gene_type:complete